MKNLIGWILDYYYEWKRRRRVKKKIKELRKQDPFTYNH